MIGELIGKFFRKMDEIGFEKTSRVFKIIMAIGVVAFIIISFIAI